MEPAAIREIGVFSRLDENQCERVASACRDLEVDAGTKLTQEGEFGYAMIAVKSGTAEVYKDRPLIRTLANPSYSGSASTSKVLPTSRLTRTT